MHTHAFVVLVSMREYESVINTTNDVQTLFGSTEEADEKV